MKKVHIIKQPILSLLEYISATVYPYVYREHFVTLSAFLFFFGLSYVYRKQNNILISNDDPILILFRANHY